MKKVSKYVTHTSRREILGATCCSCAVAVIIYLFLLAITPFVSENSYLLGYVELTEGYSTGDISYFFEYILLSISQLNFIVCSLGAVGMIVFSYVAAYLERKNSKYKGTGVGGHGGIFNKMLTFAILATIASALLYGDTLSPLGFVPIPCVFLFFHHYAMFYGVGAKQLITVFVATVLLAVPCCIFTRIVLVDPLGLPIFLCVASGALLFMLLCNMIFRVIPWMVPASLGEYSTPADSGEGKPAFAWFFNRQFGDIGDLGANGSSVASVGLIVFCIISYCLNPASTGFGVGLFPLTLFAILVTGALAVYIFYPYYKEGPILGFSSLVVVSTILITYPLSWEIVAITIVFAAIVPVSVIGWVIKVSQYKGEYCMFPLIMLSLCITLIPYSLFVQQVLVPLTV